MSGLAMVSWEIIDIFGYAASDLQRHGLVSKAERKGTTPLETPDMIDLDQISATVARDCPRLRGLGGRTDALFDADSN
jgi:hypothetical protein